MGQSEQLQSQTTLIWGFHSHGGTPIAGWFRMENPMKMDDLGGTPILGNLQMDWKHPFDTKVAAPCRRSLAEHRTLWVHCDRMGGVLLLKPSGHRESGTAELNPGAVRCRILNVQKETPGSFHHH